MGKKIKAKAPKSVAANDVEPKDVKAVQAGKVGANQQQYLRMTMENVKAPKIVATKDLEPKDVKGGRKAGSEQHEYLKVTMEDVLIS